MTDAFAVENETIANQYFSVKIPDTWTYIEYSNTPESYSTGYGPPNQIKLTPREFSDLLMLNDVEKFRQKIEQGSAYASFSQNTEYRIRNAPLELFVKHLINELAIQNITSQHYTTVGNEESVNIYANDMPFGNTKIALYAIIHDKEPYSIIFKGDAINYEKYLPEFEQMVKSFKFLGSSNETDRSEKENETNTKTNFSGANLTELNTNGTSDSTYPEELYDEYVRVAGESLCDFLFKK